MAKKDISRDEPILVPTELIKQKIFEIRGRKVMLDSDLAALYGVETKMLNRSMKRNLRRFPEDFMFQLTSDEFEKLRFQFGTSNQKRSGGRRYLPYVFTEQGVAMLSGVLNSDRAIEVNIGIMRAFVGMRTMLATNDEIKQKLAEIEVQIGEHSEYFKQVFAALRLLMKPKSEEQEQIGYIRNSN